MGTIRNRELQLNQTSDLRLGRVAGTGTKAIILSTVVAVLLVGSARPARADGVFDWIGVLGTAIAVYQEWEQHHSLSVEDATQQILAKIQSAQVAIDNHIDAVAVAPQRACVDSAIGALANEVLNRANMSAEEMQDDATAAQSCVNGIIELMTSVGTPAVDQLGVALAAIEPLVGMLNANVGWTTTPFTFSQFRTGNTFVSNTLLNSANCQQIPLWGDCEAPCRNPEVEIICTDYDGTQAFGDSFLRDPHLAQEVQQTKVDSLRATSYALAQQGLASFP
jgi:hypothetical protein